MSKECCKSEWLSSAGTFLMGLAAILAVCFSKEPVTNYLNNIKNIQMMTVNLNLAEKQTDNLIEKAKDPKFIDEYLKDVPDTIPYEDSKPLGLVVLPQYRGKLKAVLTSNDMTADQKKAEVNLLWQKSLSKRALNDPKLKWESEK